MSQPSIDQLVIAISSRALFDLTESHRVYEEEGLDAYQKYQIAREEEPLQPGDAFSLVKKLLHYPTIYLREGGDPLRQQVVREVFNIDGANFTRS